jgi:hypothetical protein
MKHVQIEKPCSEDWNKMNPTQKGAFCQKCATEVIDFTNKSTTEIKSIFREMIGQSVCSRISDHQLITLNEEFENWQNQKSHSSFQSKFLFAMIIVFGLSLFSCETEEDRKTISKIQKEMSNIEPTQPEGLKKITSNKLSNISILENINPINNLNLNDLDSNNFEEITETFTLDEIKINADELVRLKSYGYLGGMGFTRIYQEFLLDSPTEFLIYDENGQVIPNTFQSKVFPNPAVTSTKLEIGFPEKDNFEIHLYDISGKFIQIVQNGELEKGTHLFPIDLSEQPPGTYLVIVHSQKYNETIRVIK